MSARERRLSRQTRRLREPRLVRTIHQHHPSPEADAATAAPPRATGGAAGEPAAASRHRETIPRAVPAKLSTDQRQAKAFLREIEEWCAATGTKETDLGAALFKHAGFVALLRKRLTIRPDKIAAVRAYMAGEEPVAADAATSSSHVDIAAEIAAEAVEAGSRRREARKTSALTTLPARPISTVEQIQTEGMREPGDVVRAVQRQHPEMWSRCIVLGRALSVSPVAALYRALDVGLDAVGTGETALG